MNTSKDRILGPLPNPFLMKDGSTMKSREQWPQKRQELLDDMLPIFHGMLPPKPEIFHIRKLHQNARGCCTYMIEAGTKEKKLEFPMRIYFPKGQEGPLPVILTGDGCWMYWTDEIIREANAQGFLVAEFDRTILAEDDFRSDFSHGLYPVYPEYQFGAIAAWAWGYHRCIDALELIDRADTSCIGISGHSRGGKTTLLAAATDERILFTQANCSGAGGAGCFRYEQYTNPFTGEAYENRDRRSEWLADFQRNNVPFWFGPKIFDYVGKEEELPFDLHYLKAAIAPRYLLETTSFDDVWADPVGAYQTFRGAKEIYKFLGVADHIASYYRYGEHFYGFREFQIFLEFIQAAKLGRPFLLDNAESIFDVPLIFDWRAEEV